MYSCISIYIYIYIYLYICMQSSRKSKKVKKVSSCTCQLPSEVTPYHSGSLSHHWGHCWVLLALLPAWAVAPIIIHQDITAYAALPLWSAHLVRASHQRGQKDIMEAHALHWPASTWMTGGRDPSQLSKILSWQQAFQHSKSFWSNVPCPREEQTAGKKLFTLLDLCVSSLRRGHANLLCIVPILTDDPRRESKRSSWPLPTKLDPGNIFVQCALPSQVKPKHQRHFCKNCTCWGYFGTSYLLGLLAMIKCSICSYQCDNWYSSNRKIACHANFSVGRLFLELARGHLTCRPSIALSWAWHTLRGNY